MRRLYKQTPGVFEISYDDYNQMIEEAISAAKEEGGKTVATWMSENYPGLLGLYWMSIISRIRAAKCNQDLHAVLTNGEESQLPEQPYWYASAY